MKEMIQKNIEEFSRLQDYMMASEKRFQCLQNYEKALY